VCDRWVVATDAPEIAAECARFGAAVELTAASHPSGTDRIAEVAGRPGYEGYEVVVNVQGDEPFVTVAQVAGAVAQWVALPVHALEETERLEQLRPLHHGFSIGVARLEWPVEPGVDTPDDLRRAEARWPLQEEHR
jgi:CMP-2-keto-3-deoxyoctulosonic acid synthetase